MNVIFVVGEGFYDHISVIIGSQLMFENTSIVSYSWLFSFDMFGVFGEYDLSKHLLEHSS